MDSKRTAPDGAESGKMATVSRLVALRAVFDNLSREETLALRRWTKAYGISFLGDSVCQPRSAATLGELYEYAKRVRRTPFKFDKGVGNHVLMELRYKSGFAFRKSARDLLDLTCRVYVDCLCQAATHDFRNQLETTDRDALYFKALASEHHLSPDEIANLVRLANEYPSAGADRKWEIHREFQNRAWREMFRELFDGRRKQD